MKVKCSREELLEAIQISQRAISTRSMLPILSGILFKAEGNTLSLSATDLEISIRLKVKGKVAEKGSLVMPGRLIFDILSNLEDPSVELSLVKEKGQLEVLAGESKFDLNVLFEEDFPKIPVASEIAACKVNSKALLRVVKEVTKAASRDEAKPILTGVLTNLTKKTMKMVATDSYRLALCEEKIEAGPEEALNIIIPARALRELARMLSATESKEVLIGLTDNQVVFRLDRVELISRLIEGDFPNYQQLLPETYEKMIRMNKERLIGATRRVSLLAQDSTPIKLSFANNLLVISASTQDVGEAAERLDIEYPGEEVKIAFNPGYFMDGITSIAEDELVLELTDPLKPALIRPVQGKSFLYLIMPVRLV